MLFKVLEQSDNTENLFDDSFMLRDIIAALGKIDNTAHMEKIAKEIYRQFRLDQIACNSPQFAVTCGAIKGYYNLRKEIFRFKKFKEHHIASATSTSEQECDPADKVRDFEAGNMNDTEMVD